MSNDPQSANTDTDRSIERTATGDLLDHIDVEGLLDDINVSEMMTRENASLLLRQTDFVAVIGQFGATFGREFGSAVGSQLGAMFDSTERAVTGDDSRDTTQASASDPTESDEAVVETPETTDQLEDMSYRDLQLLTKGTDVSGNISREEMVEQLASRLDIERK